MSHWEDAFFDTLRSCLNLVGQRGYSPAPTEVHVHTLDPLNKRVKGGGEQLETCLANWERRVVPLLDGNRPHTVHVHLWGEQADGPVPHDRFVLTDQCAVAVLGGLDCRSGPRAGRTIWTLLSEGARREVRDLVTDGKSPFKLMGEATFRRPPK
jgi:hypothetical protein